MAAGLNIQPQFVNGQLSLDLRNKGLTSIPDEVFDITDLENLNVSHNKLTSVPKAIGRLKKLRCLNARNNMLTSLPQEICSLSNVEILHVCYNKLSILPQGFEKMQKLVQLALHDNELKEIPSVYLLPNLEMLTIGDNRLSSVSQDIEKLLKLRSLGMGGNQLKELPLGLCSLSNLEVLVAHNNNISTLPPGVENMRKLRYLQILGNQLTELPAEVCSLSNLEELDVSRNKLSTLPNGVEKLQKLKKLNINDNQLTELPAGVCSLPSLETLLVQRNRLSVLPADLEKMHKLTVLALSQNHLTEFPLRLCSPPNLEGFLVGGNPIRYLPKEIPHLSRLKCLEVNDCELQEFPRQVLQQLRALEQLSAGENQMTVLPDEVGNLEHLEFLALNDGFLQSLPRTISNLKKLREVRILTNKFDKFPESLCHLPELEKVNISNNQITRLPITLHRADRLKDLDVSGNPLTYPPQNICQQGTGAIMTFLRQEAEKEKATLQVFNRLSLNVAQTQLKPLARSLGLDKEEIDTIKASAPDDLPDQAYQMLLKWKEKEMEADALSVLEQHLRYLGFQDLADHLSSTPVSLVRRGHGSEVRGAVGGQDAVKPKKSKYPSVTVDAKFPIIEFERLDFPEQSYLGHGGFASVERAYHMDWRQNVAVKRLLTRQIKGSEQELLYSEARKLKLAGTSPNVISLLGVCLDPHFAIVMPYMENGSLARLLQDVDVPWALRWRMAHEISLGMTFLHCQNPQILHCDLKAENVLLDEDYHVKISDFGLSKWRTESRIVSGTSPVGATITHAPPEYITDINLVPSAKFDVYSFAVLLWELLTRRKPYENAMNSALIELGVRTGQRPDMSLVPKDVPDVDTVSQLMQTCWSQEQDVRPSFKECEEKLQAVKDKFSKENILEAIIYILKEKVRMK